MSATHISDYLEINAQNSSDKLAIVTHDRSMTWLELWQEVQAVTAYIGQFLSSDQPEVVALLMPNCWQYVVANLAIVHAGHVAMPIDVIYKPLEIEAILKQMNPALLITDSAGASRVGKSQTKVIRADDFPKKTKTAPKLLRQDAGQQVASLLFTSGTTGKPKAVPYTHANHIWNIEVCSRVWQWTANDSLLISLRLSHWYGLVMGLSGAVYHGNTLYLHDGFDAQATLKTLASGNVTMFTHGPLVYSRLINTPNASNYDLSKVRLFISGSGPLPPAIWQSFKETFGAEILEVYGSTETGRIASNLLNERIPGSPGRVLPGVELKFDEHGQVMVRSPGLFPGYWNNSQATKKARDDQGFWRTGDLGKLENERLLLLGRVQEKIRRRGYTISPRDIEWALHNEPQIKEILVMGVQQPQDADDELVYFIVSALDPEAINKYCKENLPSVWRPDRIIDLPALPRTRTGKPDLAKLRAMLN